MYNEGIKKGLKDGMKNHFISRKIYLSYPTYAFAGDHELEFELLDSISTQFKIPITSIQVAGSAKTGYSYQNSKDFIKGNSDLDIAIIDSFLFQKYSEIVFDETKGLKDLSKFKIEKEVNQYKSYIKYLANGYFRPDLMPASEAKKDWFNFFNKLSQRYITLFSDINAGIYLSQLFYEYKQSSNIELYKNKLHGKV